MESGEGERGFFRECGRGKLLARYRGLGLFVFMFFKDGNGFFSL